MIMYPPPFAIFNETLTDSSESSSIILSSLIGFTLSLIALLTAMGNMIVLLAFYYDKKLRTINDYFILNMAIADFLVGSFCIPFYIPFSLTQSWPFGRLFCKIWVTVDDVATMASVINIVAISINRYWSIAYPIVYRKYVKQQFVYIVMASVWLLSFLNFAPGIWLIHFRSKETNETETSHTDCSGDYHHSFAYMLIAQFNYFIWPFIVLCVLNMLIMINIWKRSRKMSRMMTFTVYVKSKEENASSSLLATSKDVHEEHRINSIERCPSVILEENEPVSPATSPSNRTTQQGSVRHKTKGSEYPMAPIERRSSKTRAPIKYDREESQAVYSAPRLYREESVFPCDLDSSIGAMRSPCHVYNQKRSRIVRDRRAARSLFILVLVFLIFLFPYVICATASTAGLHISAVIFEIAFWLLWLNSTCNPFLYPFIQMKYRKAYWKLFQSCTQSNSFSRSTHSF